MRPHIIITIILLIACAPAYGEGQSSHLTFTPAAGRDFDFQFAYQNAANFYRLAYNVRGRSLVLSRTRNGVTIALAALDDVSQTGVVGIRMLMTGMRVELNGRTVMTTPDTSFRSGGHALDGRPDAATSIPLAPIEFDENFSDAAKVEQRWHSARGRWRIISPRDELVELRNGQPMFTLYRSQAADLNLAIGGEPHWSDVAIHARLGLSPGSRAGIAFNIFDTRNYSALLLTAGNGRRGYAELVDFRDGIPVESLRFDCESITADTWHEIVITTHDAQQWCVVNGQTMFTGFAHFDATSTGRIGLISWGGAEFDTLSVRSADAFNETFHTKSEAPWRLDGEWHWDAGLHGTGTARFLHPIRGPRRIDAQIEFGSNTTAAIMTNIAGTGSYYAFGVFDGQWQFRRVINQQQRIVARADASGDSAHISLITRAGILECMVDGKTLFTMVDAALPSSDTGLLADKGVFRRFRIAGEPLHRGAVIFSSDFFHSRSKDSIREQPGFILGDIFKPSGLGWHYGRGVLQAQVADALFFTHSIPGRVSIEAEVAPIGQPFIVLAADAAGEGGYRFGIDRDGNIILTRNGQQITRRPLPAQRGNILKFELLRRGSWLLARIDGHTAMAYNDPEPLPDGYAGCSGDTGAEFHSLTIRSESATQYQFDTAAHSWVVDRGEWVVRQGVPDGLIRHWITGYSDGHGAHLWENVPRGGDIQVQLTLSPHTRGFADGGSRTYVYRNIGINICATPGEPSGYGIVIRPHGEQVVQLVARGKVVAQEPVNITGSEPVRVGVLKSGSSIEIRLDGKTVLAYDQAIIKDEGFVGLSVQDSFARFSNVLIIEE